MAKNKKPKKKCCDKPPRKMCKRCPKRFRCPAKGLERRAKS